MLLSFFDLVSWQRCLVFLRIVFIVSVVAEFFLRYQIVSET